MEPFWHKSRRWTTKSVSSSLQLRCFTHISSVGVGSGGVPRPTNTHSVRRSQLESPTHAFAKCELTRDTKQEETQKLRDSLVKSGQLPQTSIFLVDFLEWLFWAPTSTGCQL